MWDYLKNASKPIVLYGMGNGADKVLSVCAQRQISVAGIFASDEFVRHNQFHGYTVTSYLEAKAAFGDMIVLVCFGTSRPEVLVRIANIAKEQELYIPDLPVFGDGLFTREYYLTHEKEFNTVESMLADEQSRTAWSQLLQYRLTWKPEHLFAAQTDNSEPWQTILKPSKDEHFLDLGAYCGDTVQEFVAHVPAYRAITALEPDPKTYQKLCKNTDALHDCSRIHAAVGDTDGTRLFATKAGRGSALSDHGVEIPAVRVDSLSPVVPFTLVNMDVEGAELAALCGMEETIRNDRPKLQIAAYHRTEDYYVLPLKVLSLNPSYRVYFRHFCGIPAWDTNFYFV